VPVFPLACYLLRDCKEEKILRDCARVELESTTRTFLDFEYVFALLERISGSLENFLWGIEVLEELGMWGW
jgi:hypothetical protein